MSDKKLIAPSMLAADFSNLSHDIAVVNQSDADWFHLDVMDGVFVPNISFGMPVIKSMAKHTTKPLDVHLMIVELNNHQMDVKRFCCMLCHRFDHWHAKGDIWHKNPIHNV